MKKGLLALLTICMSFLLALGGVSAETIIKDEFDESFVNALIEKGYIDDSTKLTKEWALTVTELDLSDSNINRVDNGDPVNGQHMLEGYFPNLESLNLKNNNLGGIPNLPGTLKILNVSNNKIQGLPNFTGTLVELYAADNELTAIPEPMSGTLQVLNVANNKLTALPGTLSPVLTTLNVSGNLLTALPELPNTLTTLVVSYNQLSALPVLPASLTVLSARDNELPGLPDLPASLKYLGLGNNKLEGLPALPQGLEALDLENYAQSGLPVLPATLVELNITGTSITTVLSLSPDTLNVISEKEITISKAVEKTTTVAPTTVTTQVAEANPNTVDNAGLYFVLIFAALAVVGLTTKSLVKHH